MTVPATMHALLQKGDGYSGKQTGISIDTLEPYLEYAEIPVPELKDGQVLVRMAMANINPSDLHFIKGEYGQPRQKGKPAGFEGVGEVVAGSGAYAEKLIGQRVAFTATPDGSGTWADYAVTAAKTCIPVKHGMLDEDAAGHIVNPLTAMAMFDLVRKANTESFVLTAGASQLCKLIIALAKDEGYRPIVVVRRNEMTEPLKALGAAYVLDENDADVVEQFKQISRSEKPRIMLDAVSNQLSSDIFFAMPNRANWVIYGKLDSSPITARELGQFVFMDKVISGFWLTKWFNETSPDEQKRVIGEVQDRFISRKWTTDVSAVIPLAEVMEKLPATLAKRAGKVLLTP
ncbi:alcohol dehydrogenase catalytic domain-containing protein [Rhizobium sp. L1K21]|uniref:alcohol dehydrogenase catalytic domain-containing protein n=1 Tax=Rhizobium sp. L1K21 TaxID=2954933 RepID=UPI002093DEA7|nr:zinc-binding dehydrogenase [Rhizobium sp. L1K21]MCO6186175.1 zinc-binding dehydrogenase [Rhizobium sp. L1K21]